MRNLVRAGAWVGFHEYVRELGGDPDAILAEAQIAPDQLVNADAYLPSDRLSATLEIAARRLQRPDFGLRLGARQSPATLGALSLVMLNAPTLREGLLLAARYAQVHSTALYGSISPIDEPGLELVALRYDLPASQPKIQLTERALANLNHTMSVMSPPGFRASQVWFTHKAQAPLRAYLEVFGVEPRFEQPMMGIVTEQTKLDAPVVGGSGQIRRIAEAYLASISSPRADGFAATVAGTVRSFLESGVCSATRVADALGMHERTLQRRLRDLGLSFEGIKDEARRELAGNLLRQSDTPLAEIAVILGYNDASTLTRSCRRWFGAPPSAVRQGERSRSGNGAPAPRPRRGLSARRDKVRKRQRR